MRFIVVQQTKDGEDHKVIGGSQYRDIADLLATAVSMRYTSEFSRNTMKHNTRSPYLVRDTETGMEWPVFFRKTSTVHAMVGRRA